jgi:hypothetical protein
MYGAFGKNKSQIPNKPKLAHLLLEFRKKLDTKYGTEARKRFQSKKTNINDSKKVIRNNNKLKQKREEIPNRVVRIFFVCKGNVNLWLLV